MVHRLTTRERELLAYLAARPFELVSQQTLLVEVWGYAPTTRSRAVERTLNRLRAKVEPDPAQPRWLHMVHGEDLRFTPPPPEPPANTLAPEVDRFVGRATEQEAVHAWWNAGDRFVSLVGPPAEPDLTVALQTSLDARRLSRFLAQLRPQADTGRAGDRPGP